MLTFFFYYIISDKIILEKYGTIKIGCEKNEAINWNNR